MKTSTNSWTYLIGFEIVLVFFLLFLTTPFTTENQCKKYIIENSDDVEWVFVETDTPGENRFKMDTFNKHYYTDATIKQEGDYYHVVFWGDRYDWKWKFKKDKSFSVSVKYLKSKGEDVSLDKQILRILEQKNGITLLTQKYNEEVYVLNDAQKDLSRKIINLSYALKDKEISQSAYDMHMKKYDKMISDLILYGKKIKVEYKLKLDKYEGRLPTNN